MDETYGRSPTFDCLPAAGPVDAINKAAQFGDISFHFKTGLVNGHTQWFVQYWLTEAAFCTIHQGWFDEYAYKFKFRDEDMPDAKLLAHITKVFIKTQHPKRKDFRDFPPTNNRTKTQ